jgi:protein gp37
MHHRFQVLTKRAERLERYTQRNPAPPNVWLGVSVENSQYAWRIDHLRRTPARVRFLSIEPLLGPISKLDVRGIDWVIVGGESGAKSRPVNVMWVRAIRDRCRARGVPFFFKQWGGFQKKRNGRELDGRTWDEMPVAAGLAASTGR